MNRLLDQILSGNFLPPESLDDTLRTAKQNREAKDAILYTAKRAVAVDVRNVYDWCMHELAKKAEVPEGIRIFSDLYPVCPNRLPFESMWLEYASLLEDDTGREQCQHGILLQQIQVAPPGVDIETVAPDIAAIRFLRLGTVIPMAIGGFLFAADPAGTGLSNIRYRDCTEAAKYAYFEESSKRIIHNEMIEAMLVTINALVFFSCKNVSMKKGESRHKASKANLKKKGFALPDFHIIEIHRFMEKNSRSRISHPVDRSIADAHVVRGHFKTFTEESPLLGHAIGTYFWHAHVRGEGQPKISDYRVWGPSKKHERKCVINQ